jgi:hypothetical protein
LLGVIADRIGLDVFPAMRVGLVVEEEPGLVGLEGREDEDDVVLVGLEADADLGRSDAESETSDSSFFKTGYIDDFPYSRNFSISFRLIN